MTTPRGSVVCLGEALIDLVALDRGVGLGRVRAFAPAPGGAPANVAVGIARLGGRSAFIGRLGDDPFGHAIADEMGRNSVDVTGIRFDPEARTALAFVAIDPDGDREFLFYREGAADMLLGPGDVDPDQVARAAALHVGTVSLSTEPSAAATREALRIAGVARVPRSCDVNLRRLLWRDPDDMLAAARELVAVCDVVKASADEAALLTGLSDPLRGAERLVASGARLAVVTCAADGASYATRDGAAMVPGFASRAVDTTGAGDAFVAALLVELARGGLLHDALEDPARVAAAVRIANAAGALATQRRGAIPALPTRAEVDALLRGSLAARVAG